MTVGGTSLAVQWLGLCASVAGRTGLTLGWRPGSQMPCGMIKKKKNKKTCGVHGIHLKMTSGYIMSS